MWRRRKDIVNVTIMYFVNFYIAAQTPSGNNNHGILRLRPVAEIRILVILISKHKSFDIPQYSALIFKQITGCSGTAEINVLNLTR